MGKEYKLAIVVDAETGKAASGLGGLSSKLQSLGKVALGLGAAGAAGLGAAGVALTKLAIDAAPLEGIENAFKGIAETSGKSASEMLTALQKGSSGMISQRDLMTSYNQAAQLVGATFANELPNAMGYLSKVSAATGEDMGFMLDSLVRGVGRLSPMILDNLGIQVDLAAAYEAFAPTIGKTVDELTKEEQQAALTAQVMEKLAQNTAAMPEVAGSAAQKVAALGVKFKDFKDRAGKALLPILSTVAGKLLDLADRALPVVAEFVEGTLVPALEGLVNTFGALFDAAMEGEMNLSTFKAILEGLLPPAVVDAVMGLVSGLQDLYNTVAPIVSEAVAWVTQFVSWKDILIALGVAVAAVVIPAIVSLVAGIAPLLAAAAALIAIIAVVRNAWENNWGGIRDKVQDVLSYLGPAIQSVLGTIQKFWDTHGENILEIARNTWDSIKTLIGFVINTVLNIIKLVLQIIQGDWEGAWETVKEIASDVWNTIVTLIQNATDSILRIFGTTLSELLSSVKSKFTEIKDAISGLMEEVKDYLSGIDLASIGRNIMQSLKDGIMSKVQDILDAVRRAIERIKRAAEEALDAFSPSRVFIEMGKGISEGLAVGIEAAAQLPVASTRGMISGVIDTGRAGVGAGAGGMVILAPVFLDPREYTVAGGEIDYAAVGQRLRELQGGI